MEQIEKRFGKVFLADGKQAVTEYNDAIAVLDGLGDRVAQAIYTGSDFARNNRNPAYIPIFTAFDMTSSPLITMHLVTIHGKYDGKSGMSMQNGIAAGLPDDSQMRIQFTGCGDPGAGGTVHGNWVNTAG